MGYFKGKMPWSEKKAAVLCQQLSYLLESGLPLLESIDLVLIECSKKEKKQWGEVKSKLEQGVSFSQALSDTGAGAYLVTLVHAGEYNGQYALCLLYASKYYEDRTQWKQKVFQLTAYPLFLFFLSGGALYFLIHGILPQILSMYSTMQITVPPFTLWLSQHESQGPFVLLLFLPLLLLFRRPPFVEDFCLRVPLVSRWLRLHYSYHFSLQWGMLLESGVSILQVCRLFAERPPWPSFREKARGIAEGLQEGKSLSRVLEEADCFTTEMVRFTRLGEEGGQLGKCLLASNRMAEESLKKTMEIVLRWLEPGLLLLLGGVVLVAVLAFFLPILDMVGSFQ